MALIKIIRSLWEFYQVGRYIFDDLWIQKWNPDVHANAYNLQINKFIMYIEGVISLLPAGVKQVIIRRRLSIVSLGVQKVRVVCACWDLRPFVYG